MVPTRELLHAAEAAPPSRVQRALRRAFGPWPEIALGLVRRDAVDLDGVALRLGPHLAPSVARSMLSGSYEGAERAFLQRVLRPDDRVLELGSGLGVLAVIAARVVGSEQVHCYEANPAIVPHARAVFRRNGVAPALHHALIAAETGVGVLWVPPDFWRASTRRFRRLTRRVEVPSLAFTAAVAAARPTVLIVDVEGAELELSTCAGWGSVRAAIVELHPEHLTPHELGLVLSRLEAHGLVATHWCAARRVGLFVRRG